MGFEYRFFGNGSGKTESVERKNAFAVLAGSKSHLSARSTNAGEEDDFGK
jgi:hypothetical protein